MEKQMPSWVRVANLLMLVICYLPWLYLLSFLYLLARPWDGNDLPLMSFVYGYLQYATIYAVLIFLFLLLSTASKKQFYLKKTHYILYAIGMVLAIVQFFWYFQV